jgi:type II secretory pathway component GspD/PulD (secretin)
MRTERLKGLSLRTKEVILLPCFFAFLLSYFSAVSFVSAQVAQAAQKAIPMPKEQERISLDLKGVDIVELLRILSLKTGFTIVPSKGVSGRINIFLNNVTFEDALDIILVSQNLAVEKRGNIIYIMTNTEYRQLYGRDYTEKREYKTLKLKYAKPSAVFTALSEIKSDIGKVVVDEASGTIILIDIPEKLALMEKTIGQLDEPLETAVFDINYSKVEDIKAGLSNILTPGTGELVVDERSSKAFVSDLPERMKKIKRVLKAFDEEERQVFIEAEILQVTLDNRFQRGINWEKIFNDKHLDGLDFIGKFPLTLSSYGRISIGTLARDNYTALLDLMQTYGDTKVLSRPKLAVVNNQEAKILVGSREAYVTQTQSLSEGTTVTAESIEFVDVGVKLNVVPTIGKDGFITMKIKPEVSSVRETLTTSLGSTIPIVETSEVETVVKVKDGTTIMLAGLIKDEDKDTQYRIPLLSRLPIVGFLFGNRDRQKKKTETIVFITPRLTSGETALPGTELEKYVPKEIMPEDLKNATVLKEIDKIKAKPLETLAPLPEEINFLSRKEIGDKLKGIKKGDGPVFP